MTPLIDVVFILLMFFMLASSFKNPGGLELRVPGSAGASELMTRSVILRVADDSLVWLDGESLTIEELRITLSNLSKQDSSVFVRVQSDDGVTMQQLVNVLDVIGVAGLSNVSVR